MNTVASVLIVFAAWAAFASLRSLHANWRAFRALAGQSMLQLESRGEVSLVPVARIAAEVSWAAQARIPYAVLCVRLYGMDLQEAAANMRLCMRAHEMVARFDQRTLLVGAWNVDAGGAIRACSRLTAAAIGTRVVAVDAAVAIVPQDGDSLRSVVPELDARLRPIELVHEAAALLQHEAAAVEQVS